MHILKNVPVDDFEVGVKMQSELLYCRFRWPRQNVSNTQAQPLGYGKQLRELRLGLLLISIIGPLK